MDLSKICKVIKTTYETEVNELIENGWILINTYTECYDPELFPKHQTLYYSLGLPYDKKGQFETYEKSKSEKETPEIGFQV